jgi:hypothetical protein
MTDLAMVNDITTTTVGPIRIWWLAGSLADLARFSTFSDKPRRALLGPNPMSHKDRKRPKRSGTRERTERLQVMLPTDELATIDEFRFQARMPSRSAAVRELLRRGLASAEED